MFGIFAKNSKIQNGRHFWRDKIFLKIGMATLQIYPVAQKFRRNRSILQGFRDISIFMFCNFCEKFENSKWPPFLARQNFFQNWDNHSAEIPCGSKISSKSLYLARFRDISIFGFCNFCENFENSKWPPFLARQKFFENWENYSAEIPCGSKISSKSLYLARFSRYKHFCVFLIWKIRND